MIVSPIALSIFLLSHSGKKEGTKTQTKKQTTSAILETMHVFDTIASMPHRTSLLCHQITVGHCLLCSQGPLLLQMSVF